MNVYGLIGYPLGHSFSSQFFNEKFENEGLSNSIFKLFPLQNISEFPGLLTNPLLRGLAVTIPYKQAVMPLLDECTEEAEAIGAVNCIKISSGVLQGFNTDVKGFEISFLALKKDHHNKALVLGTGGASKAVQFIFKKLNIPFKLVSRNASVDAGIISYAQIDQPIMDEYKIIVNCTPVGMFPHEDLKPAIPYQYLTAGHYLYDLVYKPDETLFLKEGSERGAVTKNGFEMLILQAEENWRIWNSS